MGKIIDAVFGGGAGQDNARASWYAKGMYGDAKDATSPYVTGGQGAFGAMGGMLGLGGTDQQDAAFKNYMNSTGYNFLLDSGSKAITGNMASKGLLNSGATAKALTTFGQNLASTQTQNYMNNLAQMAGIGTQAAGIQANAGANSASTYAGAKKNMGNAMSDAFGSAANFAEAAAGMSDPRLKTFMVKVGELANGCGLYIYRFLSGGPLQWGANADEVALHQPKAAGPTFGGYRSVNYAALQG